MNHVIHQSVKVIMTEPDKAQNRTIIIICQDDYAYYFKSVARADTPKRWAPLESWEDMLKVETWDQRIRKTGKYRKLMELRDMGIVRRLNRKHVSDCHQDLLQYIL